MITHKISPHQMLQGAFKLLLMKTGRTFFSVNLEVTQRCNLRCNACGFWRRGGDEERLKDYAAVIRHLNPLHLTITGGEPLLRDDLEEIIRTIRAKTSFVYMNLITNGSLLTVDRARSLWHAGLNQVSISLDFPDARHDAHRGRPGLWRHLAGLIPQIASTEIDNLSLNTVIMRENLDDLLPLARAAKAWGIRVSFSTYNPFKDNNPEHVVLQQELPRLEQILEELLAWKRQHRNVTNSDAYLRNIPRYFREGGIPGCLAGRKWVQVGPEGLLRRCSDKEVLGSWREIRPNGVPFTACRDCWYACRGEAEVPLGLRRIVEVNR